MFGVGRPVSVDIPRQVPFDPAKRFGKGWAVRDEKCDARAARIFRFHFEDLSPETGLHWQESHISGHEKLVRLIHRGLVRLDADWLIALIEEPGQPMLKYIQSLGVKYLDAFGTILVSPFGDECVLYAHAEDFKWKLGCRSLAVDWGKPHITGCWHARDKI